MAYIYISVGSNEQKELKIRAARKALTEVFGELQVSNVFESESVGFVGESFYNLVIGACTELSPKQVDQILKKIEQQNGRIRGGKKFSNRIIDLDLLLYDNVISTANPQIPRQEIIENAFVLQPLSEIAPNLKHPQLQQTYLQLWQNYSKPQVLKSIEFNW